MNCPYCGSEVAHGAPRCERCDVRIRWHGDEVEFETRTAMVPVFTARDPATLPVVESLLEANGIPHVVANDLMQDMVGLGRLGTGYNPVTGPPVVRVPEDRADEALRLLRATADEPLLEMNPNG